MHRILVVEDDEMSRDIISRRLRKQGFDVIMASDGGEAIEKVREEAPGVVLMDIRLPRVDGLQATRTLKGDARTRAVPIIALTADAMESDRQKAFEAGCDEYETKPVDYSRLLEKIRALLSNREEGATLGEVGGAEEAGDRVGHHRASSSGPSATVLVVDDNEDNRRLLAQRLTREGHRVHFAENGVRALEELSKQDFDLVLLDIMMPLMDGYGVLEKMQHDMRLRNVPVIVISASEEEKAAIRCIDLGASDYLPKPYDPILLRSRIGACLEKKRLRDQEQVYRLQLEHEKKQTENLLRGVFPYPVAQEMKATGKYRPRRYQNIAVLFCDLVGFTRYCDQQDPEEVVSHLQEWVEASETILTRHRLEKIKTVGDALMAAGGLLVPLDNPVLSCVQCGSEIIAMTGALATGWSLRVGVHVGPVVAGIVGKTQYAFDIWGDTVNLAARIEQHGVPNTVNVSGPAWQQDRALLAR